MNRKCTTTCGVTGLSWLKFAGAIVLVLFASLLARAETLRTQTVNLRHGWNAVFLEVTPTNADPAVVFTNTPVSLTAAYFGGNTPAQFIQNPSDISWKKDGWAVWYGPSRPDAFLANLSALRGNQPYLIFAEQDFVWTVSGTVTLGQVKWKPNGFTFAGFGVDATAPPTFGRFFAGSPMHQPGRIYRLEHDHWMLIANPAATAMRAGEACWIFCKGASDFQGPLSVKLTAGDNVAFGSNAESPVTLENRSPDPMTVTVQTVAPDGGLPLGAVVRGVSEGGIQTTTFDLPAQYTPPVIESGQTSSLWLKLRRERMTAATQTALLKFSTDSGAEVWVPVTGTLTP